MDKVRVIDSRNGGPDIPIIDGEGWAKAVIWPGNGARYRTFQVIQLAAGSATRDLEHAADSVYYVMRGDGIVEDRTLDRTESLVEGAMVHIDAGDRYRICAGPEGIELLGGPCPADPRWYAHAQAS